jgi:hypothetical protein
MTNSDIAAWLSVAIGFASFFVAVIALRRANAASVIVRNLEAKLQVISQSASQSPQVATGGGGGGGAGSRGGDGGSVYFQPSQSSNVKDV